MGLEGVLAIAAALIAVAVGVAMAVTGRADGPPKE